MANLQVQVVTRTDGPVVVSLIGQADIAGASVLERHLTFLSASHPRFVVFDMSELAFISSLAMGTLMQFRRGSQSWGGTITLAAAQPAVAGMFKHAALDKLLPMMDSVESALALSHAAAR